MALVRGKILKYLMECSGICFFEYPLKRSSLFLFGDDASLKYCYFGCYLNDRRGLDGSFHEALTPSVKAATDFLDAYFTGRDAALPELDVSPFTDREKIIYRKLLTIRPGSAVSYGELAEMAGFPGGGRFAGNAMAKNIFPIFIPCHRVIKSNGEPGHYAQGTEMKRFFLEHESKFWK